ncbi:MAG: hypothetical protein HQK83_17315 [Fibrobacteria bacterium]|nr:hypothetical protein [Fibrobacteria bacterium]
MPKYAIAFLAPNQEFLHKVVEMDTKESALRFFFQNYIGDNYSQDDEGYNYFVEDFSDTDAPQGNILEL